MIIEQDRAMTVASAIHQGLQQVADVRLPPLRFEQVCDDQVVPVRPGDAEPDYLVVHRSSCCMIFHGDDAGYCAPLPARAEKEADSWDYCGCFSVLAPRGGEVG